MAADNQDEKAKLYVLLQLEEMARKAESAKALYFLAVNESRKLVNYRQSFLFSATGLSQKKFKVETASSIAVIDSNEPFIVWLNNTVEEVQKTKNIATVIQLDASSCPEKYKQEWHEYSLPFVLWSPLQLPDNSVIGGIWFARETPWNESERLLIKRLTDSYAHALGALKGKNKLLRKTGMSRFMSWGIPIALVVISLIPVRISALAPVEIIAKDPVIISAPLDGVVKELLKEPNSPVKKGESLLLFEDTSLRNQYEIAKKTLSVTKAELRKASQAAFGDRDSKSEIAILKSQVELRQSELDFAQELLSYVELKASNDGLLVYSDKDDWVGRPVSVGERIMEIADPSNTKLKIELAVADAILLEKGADVEIFLDISPLHSHAAKITHTAYNAKLTAEDILAYRLDAEFIEDTSNFRIGLQGTAKIYGEKVTLFFYLFRRPISALRQLIGL